MGCSKTSDRGDAAGSSSSGFPIRVMPSLTRVTALDFEPGDCIGLSVERASGFHAHNELLTYDGSAFAGTLEWYSSDDAATLRAYYPYTASGFPQRFHALADQRAGYASCDLLGAVREEVVPGADAVAMTFRHLMARLHIFVDGSGQHEVRSVILCGLVCQADIDARTLEATAVPDAPAEEVQAYATDPGIRYAAILVPQQADLQVRVMLDEATLCEKTFPQVLLLGGHRYDLTIEVQEQGVSMRLSGQIADWTDGGTLEPETPSLPDGTLLYAGERYRTVEVNGTLWMAENLRYKPQDREYGRGYWYPQDNEENATRQGVLYNYDTALGNDAQTATERQTRVRGICPPDWHIPDHTELEALARENLGSEFFCCAGYWITGGLEEKFASQNRGLLMSKSCTEEAKMKCLFYSQPTYNANITEIPQEYGVSIRCVKN